ncbi:Na(+)-translocating NADH-quinone reductase subunit A [Tenacibaculum finnmarkense]|uniref:Na(+)-translocating NADH-quinone reductase subunit A n=1 Tax=Tenacibaculum finnmarkense genomovar finnmarkense TaxID=1458503 RepID=A0AAP1WF98_9FLAO|nr:Na(+)-translocating NADH-quinone reductase subunit A [Tenacibaculum finnmarkense]MBE7651594.1 Na(+)-translocating NADH-quinone reductase subunit A [Tenacibaculum finnmarkense genomovar finnmarkense]MBE7694057.1 Na(+)-translocating NADH-quinone reductase subunit A [Tenacibaculum finnmarkense genomovar finnmarkense]MCD8426567.1 Na(+)-translocating NADH-quinone reductase subunit A [Tenacibaculum finnmarkense genomovar finnmarkense]MCG8730359.1 Na(+)-translocating NADH-quinone reductase subunit 
MSKDIRIKKGLDIKLVGEAAQITTELPLGGVFAIQPDDFHGVIPKILAKQGTEVKAGQALFYSKSDERILFPSPVSGKISEIVRGARRKVLAIKITADAQQEYKDFGKKDVDAMSGEEVKTHLFASGCWPFVKQRPYDVIADPNQAPKSIFVSAYASAPLAADYDYALKGKEAELQTALTALTKLTAGKVHVSVAKKSTSSPFKGMKGVELHNVSGPHPVGNVSTQIAQIDPINKGEVVWVVTPQDLVVIGELLLTGKFNAKRTIALAGSKFSKPQYVTALAGANIGDLVKGNLEADNARVISGNVLSGVQVDTAGYLGYYENIVTAIPEGDDYELFGWNKPVFNKVSTSRAFTFSWLTPKKKYNLNTNTNGEHRAFVVTGSYEEVFPLDIFPMQLLKSCKYKDLDEMEGLGAYEIAPEDFALTEFICVSKQPHQKIIREGLDLMREELG